MVQKFSLLTLISFGLIFNSCKKVEQVVATSKDVQMAQDNAQHEEYSEDVSAMADDAYNNGKLTVRGHEGLLGDSVILTFNHADSTITIDFGTNGITSLRDGKTRKGKIIITFKNGYKTPGSSVTHSFSNYSVNNNSISNTSTRTITYNGMNSSNQPNWTIVSNMSFTKSSGSTSTWNSTRTRTMIAGYTTPLNWTDDQYNVTGSASGVTSLGDAYTITITTPLLINIGCRNIQDGIIVFTRGTSTATIDYGYGGTTTSCEGTALLTYNGTTKVITL